MFKGYVHCVQLRSRYSNLLEAEQIFRKDLGKPPRFHDKLELKSEGKLSCQIRVIFRPFLYAVVGNVCKGVCEGLNVL